MYYILSGRGTVTIDGTDNVVGPGDCLYIPADAEHGTVNDGGQAGGDAVEDLKWLYVFAADDFGDIVYRYS